MSFRYLFILLFYLLFSNSSFAIDEVIIISNITIEGNFKTKNYIIYRELDIQKGDTIQKINLENRLQANKNKIGNLNLFSNITLEIDSSNSLSATLNILVSERGYYSPFPVAYLADRSFNEWWYNRNHDFRRVIYGFNFKNANVGGRAEELSVYLEGGFSNRIALVYKIPYINKTLKTGMEFNVIYFANKQFAYKTNDDKLVFFRAENKIQDRFSARFVLKRRNNFYERQRLELSYHNESITDTIANLNPNYYLNSTKNAKFLKASYVFEGDHRDNNVYPTEGHIFIARFTQIGILRASSINMSELGLSYHYFHRLNKKWIGEVGIRGKVTSPILQAFAVSQAFGYRNENVRGYDLNVIDGQKFILAKTNLRREIWNTKLKSPAWFLNKKPGYAPILLYARCFYDAGYVSNKYSNLNGSKLANTYLGGYGFGLDLVSKYSTALRTSFSFNKKGYSGLFFTLSKDI